MARWNRKLFACYSKSPSCTDCVWATVTHTRPGCLAVQFPVLEGCSRTWPVPSGRWSAQHRSPCARGACWSNRPDLDCSSMSHLQAVYRTSCLQCVHQLKMSTLCIVGTTYRSRVRLLSQVWGSQSCCISSETRASPLQFSFLLTLFISAVWKLRGLSCQRLDPRCVSWSASTLRGV